MTKKHKKNIKMGKYKGIITLIVMSFFFSTCVGNTQQKSKKSLNENIEYKQINCLISHKQDKYYDLNTKQLEIRWMRSSPNIFRVLLEKKLLNNWRVVNGYYEISIDDFIARIYFSDKKNDYYFLFDGLDYGGDFDGLMYELYHINKDKVDYEGCFTIKSLVGVNALGIKVYTIDGKPYISLKTDKNDILFQKQIDNNNEPIDKSLLEQADSFDWDKAFSPSVFYKEFSFYEYGISEKYKIDWDKREIIPLNKAARFFLDSVVEMDPKIRFSKDTLIIGYVYYERDWEYTYLRSYYFLKSDDLNDVILNKVILDKEVAADLNAVGTNAPIATLKVKYLYDDFGNISFHDFDEIGSPYKISTDSFPLESYNRDLTLSELVKIVSNKKDVYRYNQEERIFGSGYSSFYIYPKPEEIFLRLKKTPLTLQTVEDYNNIAYYILEFARSHEQADSYTDAAVKLLEKIIVQFPDRVVTYLNLGDAYWQRDYNGDRSKARTAYKKYIELMQAQQKDMNRIPKRVPERIGSNK